MKRLSVLVCFIALAPQVWSSCGSATCPLDTRSAFVSEKGLVRVGYEFEWIDQDEPKIGAHAASVGEIPGHHDEERTINRIQRLFGTVGLTDRWSLDLSLPIISRTHRHIHNHHGETIEEGWDFTDVGDFSALARYAFYKPADERKPTLFATAGMEFPTGKSMELNADGDAADPGLTPGSASYDTIVGAVAVQHFTVPTLNHLYGVLPLFLNVNYKINGRGREDYRLGNQWTANLGTSYPVLKWVGALAQLNWVTKLRDDQGETTEEVGKTGGDYLYVSPGVQLRLADAWEWSTVVQLPLYQRVNEINLVSRYNVLSNLSYKFHL